MMSGCCPQPASDQAGALCGEAYALRIPRRSQPLLKGLIVLWLLPVILRTLGWTVLSALTERVGLEPWGPAPPLAFEALREAPPPTPRASPPAHPAHSTSGPSLVLCPCPDTPHAGCSKDPRHPHPTGHPVCIPQARSLLVVPCLVYAAWLPHRTWASRPVWPLCPGTRGIRCGAGAGASLPRGPFWRAGAPPPAGKGSAQLPHPVASPPAPGQLWLGAVTPSLLQFMASRGNAIARATFESRVPPFYYRPSASDCQ